jgi:hypothetical protein
MKNNPFTASLPGPLAEDAGESAIDCIQPPSDYLREGSYGRQIFSRLIATVLMAATAAHSWLSLIDSAPSANVPNVVHSQQPERHHVTWSDRLH